MTFLWDQGLKHTMTPPTYFLGSRPLTPGYTSLDATIGRITIEQRSTRIESKSNRSFHHHYDAVYRDSPHRNSRTSPGYLLQSLKIRRPSADRRSEYRRRLGQKSGES